MQIRSEILFPWQQLAPVEFNFKKYSAYKLKEPHFLFHAEICPSVKFEISGRKRKLPAGISRRNAGEK